MQKEDVGSRKLNIKGIVILPIVVLLLIVSFFVFRSHIPNMNPLQYGSNRPKLEYSNYIPKQIGEKVDKSDVAMELEIFPSNYQEVVESNKFNISQKNRVQLLRYGQTIVEDGSEEDTFKNAISKLSTSKTPILLTNQIVSLYYKGVMQRFKLNVIENNLQKELLEELNNRKLKEIRDTVNECKSLLVESKYEECIDLLRQKDIQEPSNNLRSIDALNSYIGINSFLTDSKGEDVLEKVSNLLNENDIEVVKKTDVSIQGGDSSVESQVYSDVDLVLLEELINSTEYLIKNLSDQNIDIADITELGKQLTYIKEYTEKQNAGEDNDVLGIKGILSALDYNPENPKFLLKSIKVKDQNILTVSPYIEEKTLVPEVLDSNFDEAYDYPRSAFVRGRIRLPILMYHHIDTTSSTNKFVAGLYVSPLEFEKQVAYLTKKNYKTVNISEFNTILSSGKNPEQKTVMITFDDGLKSHYTQAYPILKKYGQTGVFFVISNRSYITHQQLKEMANNGMGIESHSKTHPDLTKVSTEELSAEIVGSKSVLESITGKRVTGIAYPGCVADDRAFPIVQGSRYVAGFSCGRSIDISTSSKFMIPRVHIDNGLDGFIKILSVGGS